MTCRDALVLVSVIGCFAAGTVDAEPVPLEILEPAARTETVRDVPVSLGLIFPDGELPSAPGGAVVDDMGNAIPFDWEVTAWWSPASNSVKWLLLHFQASSDRTYSFVPGADPKFANPAARNYRLGKSSPCINQGSIQGWMTGALDLDGSGRVAEGAVDMGAYEYHRAGTLFRLQ